MEKTADMTTLNADLHAQIALWKFRAFAALTIAVALAFLLLCFGIGQMISGG
jgi:hypothetical protein